MDPPESRRRIGDGELAPVALVGVVERAKAKGAKLMNGPMEVPGGARIAQLTDPQGAVFTLHESAKQS